MKAYISLFLGLFVFLAASVVADPITAFSAGALSLAASSPYSMNKLACITTASFARNCGTNPGGLTPQIWIALVEDVADIPAPTNNIISTDITFTAPATAFGVWKGDKDTYKLDINSIGEGDSKAWQSMVELHRSGFTEEFEHHLSQQINGYFIVLVKDRKGKVRLIGSLDEGASFPSDGAVGTTGAGIADKNGNTLKLTWNSAERPLYYTGALPELAVA
jgi:hypothetical protein